MNTVNNNNNNNNNITSMVNSFLTFTVSKPKTKTKTINDIKIISRLCKAIILKENDEFVARISLCDDIDNPTYLTLPLTKQSYRLDNKEYVFSHTPNKQGHYTCFIRTLSHAKMSTGLSTQYCALQPNIVIAGHIVDINGNHYFDYKHFLSFNYNKPDYVKYPILDTPILLKQVK